MDYCLTGASKPNDTKNLCPKGFFCTVGAKLPTSCEDGKYSNPGAKSADECKICPAG